MSKSRVLAVAVLCFALSSSHASRSWAGALGNYKHQKNDTPQTQVTSENCPDEYKKSCKAQCSAIDTACLNRCDAQAEPFCKERESARTRAEWGLVAKGASLGVGAAGILFDDKMAEVTAGPGGVEISDYAIIYNRPSWTLEGGGGALQGGTYLAAGETAFRYKWIGFSANADYMWDQTDNMTEADFGPTLYLVSSHILAGFQPSVMVSAGNGVLTRYGGGLRALSTYVNDRFFVKFDPLLGYINSQWSYDLKVAVGYRLTPSVYADLGYSFRDILNLNDLNISDASLQGAFVHLGYRLN